MYRVQHFFGKVHCNKEWVLCDSFNNDDDNPLTAIDRILEEYQYCRLEMQRKDSRRTFVWEFERGNEKCTKSPELGDKPCKASPFHQHPNHK